jgi:hypothetical protein
MKRYLFSLFLTAFMLVEGVPAYAASSSISHLEVVSSIDPSALEYRLAVGDKDLNDILALYDGFTSDDKHCLLVCPPGKLRKKMLAQNIIANRIFVACDPQKEGNKIVSFCKLYIAQDQELLDILSNELSAGYFEENQSDIPEFMPCLPAFVRNYSLSLSSINNFSQRLVEPSVVLYPSGASPFLFEQFVTTQVDPGIGLKLDLLCDICIYFGSAFTINGYKGYGINTTLERFALSSVSSSDEFQAKFKPGVSIHYMYGVVGENFWGAAHFRSFTDYCCRLFGVNNLAASVTMHHAKKPVFEEKENTAVLSRSPQIKMLLSGQCISPDGRSGSVTPAVVFSDETIAGYGCFISCTIP